MVHWCHQCQLIRNVCLCMVDMMFGDTVFFGGMHFWRHCSAACICVSRLVRLAVPSPPSEGSVAVSSPVPRLDPTGRILYALSTGMGSPSYVTVFDLKVPALHPCGYWGGWCVFLHSAAVMTSFVGNHAGPSRPF